MPYSVIYSFFASKCLSPKNFLIVYSWFLQGKKIVVLAKKESLTVQLGETLKTLIFPFKSVNRYNPGNPLHISESLIQCMFPIYIGVKLDIAQEEFEKEIDEY